MRAIARKAGSNSSISRSRAMPGFFVVIDILRDAARTFDIDRSVEMIELGRKTAETALA